jgi:hemolysin D
MRPGAQLIGLRDLATKYCNVLSQAWQDRHAMRFVHRTADEAAFLPAVLAIEERPVSPTGRWLARVLMALVATFFVWTALGRLDIIVNAPGKLIIRGYTKTIASVDTARVRALYVSDGQRVKTGQVLIALDASQIDSEREKARKDREAATLQAARAQALLASLDSGLAPRLPRVGQAEPARWLATEQYLHDQWSDYETHLAELDADVVRYGEELRLATQQSKDDGVLLKTGDIAHDDWLQAEQKRVELLRQWEGVEQERVALAWDTRKEAEESLADAEKAVYDAKEDEARALAQANLYTLVAPIDGTVQQLTVHTVGGVVSSAQPLMQVVPTKRVIEMDAYLQDKDVGFIKLGQPAQVKIDAYDYTKYGAIGARVETVSSNSIDDDKRGLIYLVRVILSRSTIIVDGRTLPLKPGMSGTVEIKTGSRRVVSYLLSPLVRHVQGALHER